MKLSMILRWGRLQSACGPVLPFVGDRSCLASARRGKGCPPGAHAVAVGAAHRLHCAARSGVAPLNSLRSLRSLRSNRRGESDDEARWRAPTPALRCSSPPKSRPAGSPCREVHGRWCLLQTPPRWLQRRVRAGRSASLERSTLRFDCPAMLGLVAASHNSLRSLRSLRSNTCDESDIDSRCARGHEPCASRRSTGAPRPARTPLCGHGGGVCNEHPPRSTSRQGLPAGRDFGGDEQRRAGVGARQRASSTDSPRVSERNERSECSEFCGATLDRAAQCSRRAAATATA